MIASLLPSLAQSFASPITGWLAETLLYTGLLIGLVLVLRRPVSRFFGPNVAYFLWALPLIRFIMPPLTLPASMAPAEVSGEGVTGLASTAMAQEPAMIAVSEIAPQAASLADSPAISESLLGSLSFADVALPIWLLGAAGLLAWRIRAYIMMRRELLQDARPAGEAGSIRLVETPRVSSPVAFGIFDKVVALPPQFMAQADVNARDLAIEHELSHHRGYDLVANIAAQPLLALHWFNPLAWWGWRAMRTDQEAACDARVVAGRERSEKASYAEVIAGFASRESVSPNLALVAPMACPVLGEKSIIHRLRSLSMNEVPSFRRRIGLAAICAAGAALPMTASVSYAAPKADGLTANVLSPPNPPMAPMPPIPPLAPKPPLAPLGSGVDAPETPDAPTADSDEKKPNHIITILRTGEDEAGEEEHSSPEVIHREIHLDRPEGLSEEESEEFENAMEEMAEAMKELDDLEGAQGMAGLNDVVRMAMAQARAAMGEAKASMGHSVVMMRRNMPDISVEMNCDGGDQVVERDLGDGRKAVMICQSGASSQHLSGLDQARQAIMKDEQMPADIREKVLRDLDQRMKQLQNRRQVSHRVIRHSVRIRVI